MDFGADFILEESEEEISEPEDEEEVVEMHDEDYSGFECEIMDWDDDDEDDSSDPKAGSNATQPKKANLNNVGLTMSSLLEEPDQVVIGEPVICKNDLCKAAFSHINKIEEIDGKKLWKCKFCDTENEEGDKKLPNLEEGQSDVMYTEKDCKPCVNDGGEPVEANEGKDMEIIFVIDTSASMCQPVKDLKIDSDPLLKKIYDSEKEASDQQNQLKQIGPPMDSQLQSSPVEEATRLQILKVAVIKQIEKLKSEKPKAKVGLVTFNDKITIHADGSRKPREIDGNEVDSMEYLAQIGLNHVMKNKVDDTAEDLVSKVKSLKEEGRTALGSALYIALHMINEPGSRVILCTDGFANVGLGKIECARDEEIDLFYTAVMNYGKTHGISVSILACGEAGLNTKLGDVPSETGGTIASLNPNTPDLAKLGDFIAEEIKRPILAVHGKIHFVVHQSMYVKSKTKSEGREKSAKDSYYTHSIGNILKDKRIPFHFAFKESPSPAPSDQGAITAANQPDKQGTPQNTDQQGTLQNADQQGPSQNADQPGTSQNTDQQGTSQNADQHGTSQNSDKQGTPQNADQPGTSQNIDQPGTSQNTDQQGTSQNSDQQGISQNADQQGISQNADQQGTSQNADQHGTSQNADQQGPSQNADQQGTSQNTDQQGTSQNADQQGTSQNADQQGTSQNADQQGTSQNADQQGTSQNADQQGTASGVDQQGAVPTTSDQDTSSSSDNKMDVDNGGMESIPFQVHIEFTDMDGKMAHRIWTSERQKTKDRVKVENSLTSAGVKSYIQTTAGDLQKVKDKMKENARALGEQIEDYRNKVANQKGMQDEVKKLDEYLEFVKKLGDRAIGISDRDITKLKEFQDGRSASTKG